MLSYPSGMTVSSRALNLLAAVERALTWRHHRVVDAETLWTSL